MSKKNKICEICGKNFEVNIHNQKYCCKECYKIAMNNRKKQPDKYGFCPTCGVYFKLNVYNQIYCSNKCKKIARSKNKPQKETEYKICQICGKEFKLTVYNKIYCSVECRNSASNHKRNNGKKNIKTCEYCGKEFKPNSHNQKYCCKECGKDALSARYKIARFKANFKSKKCLKCGNIFMTRYSIQKYCEKCKSIVEKEQKREQARIYQNKRRNNDINYKIKCWCRNQIHRCLKTIDNNTKNKHTFDILNYSVEQFKKRIEFQFKDGMTWDNHGTLWEVHHKKELCKFNFISLNGEIDYKQMRIANSLSNLQPLTIEEHKIKTNEFLKRINHS